MPKRTVILTIEYTGTITDKALKELVSLQFRPSAEPWGPDILPGKNEIKISKVGVKLGPRRKATHKT